MLRRLIVAGLLVAGTAQADEKCFEQRDFKTCTKEQKSTNGIMVAISPNKPRSHRDVVVVTAFTVHDQGTSATSYTITMPDGNAIQCVVVEKDGSSQCFKMK